MHLLCLTFLFVPSISEVCLGWQEKSGTIMRWFFKQPEGGSLVKNVIPLGV